MLLKKYDIDINTTKSIDLSSYVCTFIITTDGNPPTTMYWDGIEHTFNDTTPNTVAYSGFRYVTNTTYQTTHNSRVILFASSDPRFAEMYINDLWHLLFDEAVFDGSWGREIDTGGSGSGSGGTSDVSDYIVLCKEEEKTFNVLESDYYVLFAKSNSNSGVFIQGQPIPVNEEWTVIRKITNVEEITVKTVGSTVAILKKVTDVDFTTLSNASLVTKYANDSMVTSCFTGDGGDGGGDEEGAIRPYTPEGTLIKPSTGVKAFMIHVPDEDLVKLTNAEIVKKYCEVPIKESVEAKKAEIEAKKKQIADLWGTEKKTEDDGVDITGGRRGELMEELSIYNPENFSRELIIERNKYIIEKEWTDNSIDDAQTLLETAETKFEELRMPRDVIDIDIIDFFDIITEKRNWDNLEIGDTIMIEYEKIGVRVKAKIIEIDYSFDSSSIKLKIANIQDINGLNNDWLKALYNGMNASVSVETNKDKWNAVEAQGGKIDALIENFWKEIGEKIEAGVTNDVSISNRGIIIKNPNEPDNMLIANNAVLAISNDGGNSWKNAITWKGIVGELLVGKQILGVNLQIEHEKGIFRVDADGVTIDGQYLNIIGGGLKASDLDFGDEWWENLNDRIAFKFTELGELLELDSLLEEAGVIYEDVEYNGVRISSEYGFELTGFMGKAIPVTRLTMDGARGFKMFRNNAYKWGMQEWEETLWASFDGTLMTKNMVAQNLAIEDLDYGYFLFKGNYMQVKDNFQDTIVEFGYLRDDGDWGLKINGYSSELLVTRDQNFTLKANGERVFWVESNGDVYANNIFANNLTLYSKNDEENPAIDLAGRNEDGKTILDMRMFDEVWFKEIEADALRADKIMANTGFIADLAVNKLVTTDSNIEDGSNDYIRIEENYINFVTGEYKGLNTSQAVNPMGKPLFWADAERTAMTTNIEGADGEALEPVFEEVWDELIKMQMYFWEEHPLRIPVIRFGAGSTQGQNATQGYCFLLKETDDFRIEYYDDLQNKKRQLALHNDYVELSFDYKDGTGKTKAVLQRDSIKLSVEGYNGEDSYIEIKSSGITFFTKGEIHFKVEEGGSGGNAPV